MTETIKQSRTVLAAERLMNLTGKGIGVLLAYSERKHQRELAHEIALAEKAPALLEKKLELAHNLVLRSQELEEKSLETMEGMNILTADMMARFYGRCASITERVIEKLPLRDLPLREMMMQPVREIDQHHEQRMKELNVDLARIEQNAKWQESPVQVVVDEDAQYREIFNSHHRPQV